MCKSEKECLYNAKHSNENDFLRELQTQVGHNFTIKQEDI